MPSAAKITAGELVLVCSRYDLGAIRSLRRFKGGSRQSPKVLIESDRGLFLLKRRAPAPNDPQLAQRVALGHQVQLFLASRGLAVARIVGTREGQNSLLELNGCIYEVFTFVRGARFDRSPAAAHEAGRLLAELHEHLRNFTPGWPPPSLTYHNHPAAAHTIAELPARLPQSDAALRAVCDRLIASYEHAAGRAESLGRTSTHPPQLIHGDWHPGNLLFNPPSAPPPLPPPPVPDPRSPNPTAPTPAPSTIAAVLDFDSVRTGPPILDLANGAFQFAVSRKTDASGPPTISLSPDRFAAFHAGYRIRPADPAVIPWLMIEAMIVETVAPIAATGHFGKLPASPALAMTARAAEWVAAEADRLVSLAAGP